MIPNVIVPPVFRESRVRGFFTTKILSCDIKAVSMAAGVSLNDIYLPIQKHTDKILALDYDLEPKIADAVITNRENVLIGVQVADCVPILLYDIKRHVIGTVHAGWRGTAADILRKTIKAMTDRYYSSPDDILIAIGAGIRWCCYEVGYEVIDAVSKATGRGEYFIKKGEKYCLDLPTANKYQAISLGVKQENIWVSDECTFCLPEKYHSYRYANGVAGRQYGFIGIII